MKSGFLALLLVSSLSFANVQDEVVQGKNMGRVIDKTKCLYQTVIKLGSTMHPYQLYRMWGRELVLVPSKVFYEGGGYEIRYQEYLVYDKDCPQLTLKLVD